MTTYTVTQTIQSVRIDGNEPVEVRFYSGPDLAQAIVALGQSAIVSDPEWVVLRSTRLDVEPEVTVEWSDDWSVGNHFKEYGDAYRDGEPETCETCMIKVDGKVAASLGCIDNADDDYRAQVEAGLRKEAGL